MKAIGYRSPEPITADDALIALDLPVPRPGPLDLRVRIHAVSVNPADVKRRASSPPPPGEARILGYDALQTGLAFLPVTILMGILSVRYTDRLVMRFGARTLVVAGLALFMTGLVLFTRAPVDGGYVYHVFPVMVLLGIGAGLCFPALMTLAMSGATPGDAGLASGLISTTAQVGGALGLAVLATLSASRSNELIGDGRPTAEALTSGYHLAFGIGAALVVVALAVAVTVLKPERRAKKESEVDLGPRELAEEPNEQEGEDAA